jgi:hypothetical protein
MNTTTTTSGSRCQRIIDLIDACLAEFGTPASRTPITVPAGRAAKGSDR